MIAIATMTLSCASADGAKNSLDWAGVYKGLIPAADVSGINVEFTLNADLTYRVIYRYLDSGNDAYVYIGYFNWDRTGNIITLNSREIPPFYRVEKDALIQLDIYGKSITGALAEKYVLRKQ